MVATRHTQSLTDFRQNATETLERLNRTGEAEVLTVNGEAKAVLLSPAAFDAMAREMEAARDLEMLRRSAQQIREGKFVTVEELSRDLRGKLDELKSRRDRAG
jgi:prevent-host-death family protein